MNKLSRKGFKAWLEARLSKKVGEQGDSEFCPIANYLTGDRRYKNQVRAEVGTVSYTVDGKTKPLPQWAERFVLGVDRSDGVVTGRKALRILAETSK